ncbi:PREDICTED: dCTP pyrophosphatase 1-like [Branchiostoma belcheri]|uniref:dCTP pyrophosphatase 1 n=1 Tax=Branchiostoma belcheri TaxID=7741 RepID=A0A6P4YFB5_BRABE|nr:PREDICTED: dCTP pyrophosphatase 1-like [Branchiostoma belcheri]
MMAQQLNSPPLKRQRSDRDGQEEPDSSEGFRFSQEPTLDQIRAMQNQFSRERNWDQFHTPRNLLLAMTGEVGEVAELFQWRGEVEEGLPDWSEKDKKHLSQELSDVLIYLVRLAEKCHVDLPAAAVDKIKLNKLKYPAHQVYGSSKKYTEYNTPEKNSS